MRVLLFLITILVGCGTVDGDTKIRNEHKVLSLGEFEPYVGLFVEQAAEHDVDLYVDDLIIKFQEIPVKEDKKVTLAICWIRTGSTPVVHVDPNHWESLSLIRRQLLIFHELGHCLLRRDHIDPEEKYSIMNPYLLGSKTFVEWESVLLEELFDPSTFNTFKLRTSWREYTCD